MANDLISRQAAIDALYHVDEYNGRSIEAIRNLPSTERRGRWILDENPHDGDCRCSVCYVAIDAMNERNHKMLNILTGGKWWTFYNYCPNCGARMVNEDE